MKRGFSKGQWKLSGDFCSFIYLKFRKYQLNKLKSGGFFHRLKRLINRWLSAFGFNAQMFLSAWRRFFASTVDYLRFKRMAAEAGVAADILAIATIIDMYQQSFDLITFSYVDDEGDFYGDISLDLNTIETNCNCWNGCGIFELRKIK